MKRQAPAFTWRIILALLLAGGALAAGPVAITRAADLPLLGASAVPAGDGTQIVAAAAVFDSHGITQKGVFYARLTRQGDGAPIPLPGKIEQGVLDVTVTPALAVGTYVLALATAETGGTILATTTFVYLGAATPPGPQLHTAPNPVGHYFGQYYLLYWGTGLVPGTAYDVGYRKVGTGETVPQPSAKVRPSGAIVGDMLLYYGSQTDRYTPGGFTFNGEAVVAFWPYGYGGNGLPVLVSPSFTVVDQPAEQLPPAPPTSPVPTPAPAPPGPPPAGGELCFPGFTQYCVSGLFRQQWEGHGGLPINGYPLTPEIQETLPNEKDVPTVYTVQYFERVRMERHTDATTGQPLVLLGQFGRTIRAPEPAVPALPGAVYFELTGHNVTRPEFAAYWAFFGGVPQFGYPLGEERDEILPNAKNEPTSYRVQYFERARLEWHPEIADPGQRVQLGQFGRAVCAERCR